MSELMIVNPTGKRRRRRGGRKAGRKHRRRARKMTALQRQYFGKKRRRRARVHTNPIRSHRRRRRSRTVSRRRRHYRRNPIAMRGIAGTVMRPVFAGLQGAGGALLNDVAFNLIPIPAQFKAGWIGTGAKAVTALGIGWAASKVVGRSMGERLTTGAMTVLLYGQLRTLLQGIAPNLLGYYGAGYSLQQYLSDTPSSLTAIPNSLTGMGDSEANPITGDQVGSLGRYLSDY